MPSSSSNRRHRRRNYTSVASDDTMDGSSSDDGAFHDEPLGTTGGTEPHSFEGSGSGSGNIEGQGGETDPSPDMEITILDSAQKRFPIPCSARWTVGTFKRRSAGIHKVAPAQQRLIFRGKMLTNDDETLGENKLDRDGLIVHLFPKPRVVVTSKPKRSAPGGKESGNHGGNNNGNSNSSNNNDNDDDDSGIVDHTGEASGGAHVTTIVIDQEEQDRRGRILVLGSVEIAESQNNVKMLSLLLVMICAMRLLALFSIATGAAEEPIDPYNTHQNANANALHNHTGDHPRNGIYPSDFSDDGTTNAGAYFNDYDYDEGFEPRVWETPDYFDLLVSALGFYVGCLGLKATVENTSLLATGYALGTILVGIGWNLWNVWEFLRFYEEQSEYEREREEGALHHHHNATEPGGSANASATGTPPDFSHGGYNDDDDEKAYPPPLTRDDFVTVAFFTILMPLVVWFLCCVRAFEFRRLLLEAEDEAAERIRNEYVFREDGTSTSSEDLDDQDQDGDGHETYEFGGEHRDRVARAIV